MTTTVKDVVRLNKQWQEVLTRVENGSVHSRDVRRSLQSLIESPFHPNWATTRGFPSWYVDDFQLQLNNVRLWNKQRGWGLTEADFPRIPRELASGGARGIPVLAVYLPGQGKIPGYIRTMTELWSIARGNMPKSRIGSGLRLDADHIHLLPGTEKAHEPGIRWVMVDPEAHWDIGGTVRPTEVRGDDSAHAEVLAIAAHFPDWVPSMNGVNVPFVCLPGYEVEIGGSLSTLKRILALRWISSGGAHLGTVWGDDLNVKFASPVRLGVVGS